MTSGFDINIPDLTLAIEEAAEVSVRQTALEIRDDAKEMLNKGAFTSKSTHNITGALNKETRIEKQSESRTDVTQGTKYAKTFNYGSNHNNRKAHPVMLTAAVNNKNTEKGTREGVEAFNKHTQTNRIKVAKRF